MIIVKKVVTITKISHAKNAELEFESFESFVVRLSYCNVETLI